MIAIFLLQDIDEPLASDYVDTASLRVVEEVVRIADNFGGCHCLTALGVEDQQAPRRSASNKQPMMSLVERHRETSLRGRSGPAGEDRALRNVSDLDFLLIGDVHENASSSFLELKRFGVSIEDDLAGYLPVRVQNSQRPGSLWASPQRLFPTISN